MAEKRQELRPRTRGEEYRAKARPISARRTPSCEPKRGSTDLRFIEYILYVRLGCNHHWLDRSSISKCTFCHKGCSRFNNTIHSFSFGYRRCSKRLDDSWLWTQLHFLPGILFSSTRDMVLARTSGGGTRSV